MFRNLKTERLGSSGVVVVAGGMSSTSEAGVGVMLLLVRRIEGWEA
jgi:hypothetical protein